ncbi:hypothetical protein CP03DC29_0946A, partial [Chlamydia psittaci 03DC29]
MLSIFTTNSGATLYL